MKSSIVFVYNSFKDPLFQATLWLYLKEEQTNDRFSFHLITYEQDEYPVSPDEAKQIHRALNAMHISWYPLKWHSGKFKLLKKAFDLLAALFTVAKIKFSSGASSIISLGTVAGSFAFILSRMFRLKTYIYQYERHSEFLVDFGIWKKKSLSNRLLHWMETVSGRNADILATGTTHMMKRLAKEGTRAEVFYLPSCVDDNRFVFDQNQRNEIRKKLGIGERRAIIYVGKFGGIYFSIDQVARFFIEWMNVDPNVYFIILSPQDNSEIRAVMTERGLPRQVIYVDEVGHEKIPSYLSAADVGVVAVPSHESQKFRSPIKVGEYLCCGLPYLVGKGISDDDQVAIDHKVGVVMEKYNQAEIEKVYPALEQIMSKKRADMRSIGVQYRGFSVLRRTGKEIFDHLYQL